MNPFSLEPLVKLVGIAIRYGPAALESNVAWVAEIGVWSYKNRRQARAWNRRL